MATINEVIRDLEKVKPHVYDDETVFKWLKRLDGMVSSEVMGEEAPDYTYPECMDEPLLVGSPHDDIYLLYAAAMVDFHNREYNDYNNAAQLFSTRLEEYKVWYIRNHAPKGAKNFRNVMG